MIRHAHFSEKEQLIQTLDIAFHDVRPNGFSIAKSQPRAYDAMINRTEEHWIDERDGKIVSVLGNLQETLTIGDHIYPFATIGSVATLPTYRHQGLMRALMMKAHQDNQENGVVFAILTGNPKVYDSLGFVPGPANLLFTFPDCFACNRIYSLQPFRDDDVAFAYGLYRSSSHGFIRHPDTFSLTLRSHDAKAVVICRDGKRIGYASTTSQYGNELMLNDFADLEGALALFPASLEWVSETNDLPWIRFAYQKGATVRLWQREMLHIYRPDVFLDLLHEMNKANFSRDQAAMQEAMQHGDFDSNAFVRSLFPSLEEANHTLSSFAYSFAIPWCDLF